MKTNVLRLRVMAVCVAAGAFVWCGVLLCMRGDVPERRQARVPEFKKVVRPAVVWPKLDTGTFRKMVVERTGPWLEARGRDAAGLMAVWEMTKDEGILSEAQRRFPDDGRVCAVLAACGRFFGAEGVKLADRVIAAEPENPCGYFLKARLLSAGRNREGALAALEQAVKVKGNYDDHSKERAGLVREAGLAAGMDEAALARLLFDRRILEHARYDRFKPGERAFPPGEFLRQEMQRAVAAADDARRTELAGLGRAVAERLVSGGTRTIANASYANYLESVILDSLPGETETGTGLTVAERREEVRARGEAIRPVFARGVEIYKHFDGVDDAVIVEYAERFLQEGEEAALASVRNIPLPVKDEPEKAKSLFQAGGTVLRTLFSR